MSEVGLFISHSMLFLSALAHSRPSVEFFLGDTADHTQ